MARRGKGGLSLGPMGLIVSIVVGLVVLIALYAFVPIIGYQISAATTVPATNIWGTAGYFTNATGLWASTSGLPVLAVLAIILGAAIYYFMGI